MFVELGYSWKNLGEYGREKFTHEEIVGEALDLPGEPQHSLVACDPGRCHDFITKFPPKGGFIPDGFHFEIDPVINPRTWRASMKVWLLVDEEIARCIGCSMEEAAAVDGGYYVGFHADEESAEYITSGGNRWKINFNGLLEYKGSRGGFENGCNAIQVAMNKDGVILVHTFHTWGEPLGSAGLMNWESSVPGNPGPWDNWEAVLEDHKTLTAPISTGELIEARFAGWKIAA